MRIMKKRVSLLFLNLNLIYYMEWLLNTHHLVQKLTLNCKLNLDAFVICLYPPLLLSNFNYRNSVCMFHHPSPVSSNVGVVHVTDDVMVLVLEISPVEFTART